LVRCQGTTRVEALGSDGCKTPTAYTEPAMYVKRWVAGAVLQLYQVRSSPARELGGLSERGETAPHPCDVSCASA